MAAARKVSAAQSRTFLPCERNTCDSLPMVVVFPVPFTPTTRMTSGVPSTVLTGVALAEFRMVKQFFFQQALEFGDIFDLLAVGLLAQLPEHFLGGRAAQIGADERGLEIVERVAVDLLAEGDDFLDALRQIFAGARDRLLHAVQEAGFLFFLKTAKQSLNHKEDKD